MSKTCLPYSALDGSIIDRFETTWRRFSAGVAARDCVRELTYAELAILVDRIAAATIAAASDRPGPVAILLPRDVYFPAAMLGVLASGRGYVPLDAGNPDERKRLIAIHSGAVAAISAGDLANRVRTLFPRELPIVDIAAISDDFAPQYTLQECNGEGDDDDVCIMKREGACMRAPDLKVNAKLRRTAE